MKIDESAVYVDQSNRRVYEIARPQGSPKYAVRDMTRLNLDIGLPGFAAVAVQRQPDTFVHIPRGDGTVALRCCATPRTTSPAGGGSRPRARSRTS